MEGIVLFLGIKVFDYKNSFVFFSTVETHEQVSFVKKSYFKKIRFRMCGKKKLIHGLRLKHDDIMLMAFNICKWN